MKKSKHKIKLDFNRMLETGIVSLIVGIIVALFSIWAQKTFGMSLIGG